MLLLVAVQAQAAPPAFFTIGTGMSGGNYLAAGRAICEQVNASRARHGLRCSIERTTGSIYNLHTLRTREFELALTQSDSLGSAVHGAEPFDRDGPFTSARTLLQLFKEPLTVVARKRDGITSIQDLQGRRVDIGAPGSGQRRTMEALMAALGWEPDAIEEPESLTTVRRPQALCDGELDAMVMAVAHPHQPLVEATAHCALTLIKVEGPAVYELVRANAAYDFATIPGGLYAGNARPINSFGPTATLVTTTELTEKEVYQVLKALFERFDAFRSAHPRLSDLDQADLLDETPAAPLHPGALRYFREAGLIR
jgi:TRAP transporter TAXI family solute receptor